MAKSKGFIICGLLLAASCGKDSGSEETVNEQSPLVDFERLGLLSSVESKVFRPSIQNFITAADALGTSINANCALDGATSFTDGSRQAWAEAMKAWQVIEGFQIGPIADKAFTLRYDIYSWPNVNYCSVDRRIAQQSDKVLQDREKGLAALEYLLYDSDLNHDCSSTVVETQGWNELDEASKFQRRCEYAISLVNDLNIQIETLESQWLSNSGFGASLIADADEAELQTRINQISDSMFYLDKQVKDLKLAKVMSLKSDCAEAPCAEFEEHGLSGLSLSAIQANIKGFSGTWYGTFSVAERETAIGLDDYFTAAGSEERAAAFSQNLDALSTTLDSLESSGSLRELTTSEDSLCLESQSESTVCDIYRKTKVLTDELKSDFLTISAWIFQVKQLVIMTSELYKIDWWGILDPLTMIGNPQKRVFILFLLSSILLASIARRESIFKVLQALLRREHWFSQSSYGDLKIILFNSFLRVLILPITGIGVAALAAIIAKLLGAIALPKEWAVSLPSAMILASLYLCFFFIR